MKNILRLAVTLGLGAFTGLARTPESQAPAGHSEKFTAASARAVAADNATNGICLNFHNVRANLVLEYLSSAGGFVINLEAEVRDPIDVWSNGPVTKDQAVELLNSTLKQHGYAVTRLGRILTVVNLDRIAELGLAEIGLDDYKKLGLASSKKALIKILGSGELKSALTIHAHKFSKSAVEKIEKAGGKAVVLGGETEAPKGKLVSKKSK